MSIKGSPAARFRRALLTRNPALVLAAAAELGRVGLPDALAICLVLCEAGSPRYSRAAVRWHARYCLEAPGLELRESAFVLGALQALGGPDADAGAQALETLFAVRGHDELAQVVEGWSRR